MEKRALGKSKLPVSTITLGAWAIGGWMWGGNDDADAAMGFGIGFGDAQNAIGVELSYVLASFGAFDRDFGTGGFNAKIHRQLADGWGVAAGWDGFLNIGDENDFDDSIYVATTKLLRTKKDLNAKKEF